MVQIGNAQLTVSILPESGGIVNDLVFCKDGSLYSLLEGLSEDEDLLITEGGQFRGAKLSPYPNRIRKAAYSFKGVGYQLPLNFPQEGNSIHGLVYDRPFHVDALYSGDERSEINLSLDFKGQESAYPFCYRLEVDYVVSGNKLQCKTRIENTGSGEMPLGDGWHPYFRLGEKVDDWQLQLPECMELELDQQLIPTGKELSFSEFRQAEKIAERHFDTCFRLKNSGADPEILLYNPENGLSLKVIFENGNNKYKYFQLFTPPSRTSIAIEPMSCPANAFNNLIDLIVLAPAEKIEFSYSVEVHYQ